MYYSSKTLSDKLENLNSPLSSSGQTQPICMTIVGSNGEIILDKFTQLPPDFFKALQELKEEQVPQKNLQKQNIKTN